MKRSLPLLVGSVRDTQGQPVAGVTVPLWQEQEGEPLATATTQPDGRYALTLPNPLPADEAYHLAVERPHFEDAEITLNRDLLNRVQDEGVVSLPETILAREVNLAFWIATLIFAGMLAVVAISDLCATSWISAPP